MPKNSSAKDNHDDEIDLLDLFRRLGKTLTKWFKAIGSGFLICLFFLLKNFIPLLASILIGIGLSYMLKWTTKPFFTSEVTFRSNTIPNAEMISYINKLNLLLREKNYSGLAGALSLPSEKASAIRDIEAFWVIDRNNDSYPDFVDYKNNHNIYDTIDVRMLDRLVIKAEVLDPKDFSLIKNGIISYVNNNPIFQQRNELRLKQTDEMLARLNYDIEQLDSLQKVKYFEETRNRQPKNGGQMVFLQEQKTQLVYEDIYKLYQNKQGLDMEKDLYPGIIKVLNDFYQPVKRHNGGFYYGKVMIPLSLGLMLIYLIFRRNRKKLREMYRRY